MPEPRETAPEVPAELIALAHRAWVDATSAHVNDWDLDYDMRAVLAAALPAHEAMVRAKVAEEIRDYADEDGDRYSGAIWEALRLAALIALGDQP